MSLTGWQVLVTRAPAQAGVLTAELEAAGATVRHLPLLRIEPASTAALLAARDATAYDWMVFTSRNGVEALGGAWYGTLPEPAPRIAVVGAGTAEAVEELGWQVDLLPQRQDAEGLLAEMLQLQPGQVLCPQAENARPILIDGLHAAGWEVTALVAYRGFADLEAPLPDWSVIDAITLASSATARRLLMRCQPGDIAHCQLVAIGPSTAATMQELGLGVAAVAEQPTMHGLVAAVQAAKAGA